MGSIEQYGKFIDGGDCFELTAEPPRKWNNLHYNQYGGTDICIHASNIGDGTTTITVDGEEIDGNIIPPFADGDHDVKVVI